ncbi:MAG: ABC transporter substrate-binding protein [Candidatus Eremiobacteraeota bacterium]|nr:ABC transporter substrate-binding protein [Candidatus Eremiobacteraeota bacterium]
MKISKSSLLMIMAVLALSAASLLLVSCAKKASAPAKIGIILPLSGVHSTFGLAQKRGYEMAIEELKQESSPLPMAIEFLMKDDEGDEHKAAEVARKLITDDKVCALIGSYSSGCTFSAIEIANYHRKPILIPSAASDLCTQKGFPWVFRINAPSSVYAETVTECLATEGKIKSVAILAESSLFGSSTMKSLEEYSARKGFQIRLSASYDPRDTSMMELLLAQVKKKNPDALVMVSYLDDAVFLMKKSRDMGINPRIFMGTGAGFTIDEFIRSAGPSSNLVCTVVQWSPDLAGEKSRAYVKLFREKYGGALPNFHSVEAYVAAKVLVGAFRRAHTADSEKIRESLLATNEETVYSKVKFESFDGYTNQNRHRMLVEQIQGSRFVLVWPDKLKQGSLIIPPGPSSVKPPGKQAPSERELEPLFKGAQDRR